MAADRERCQTDNDFYLRALRHYFYKGLVVLDTSIVQNLCRAIALEKDPDRTAELLQALREVIKDQHEEFRFRLQYVAHLCESGLADEAQSAIGRPASLGIRKERHEQRRTGKDRREVRDEAGSKARNLRSSLFGKVCLTLLHEEFRPEEL